MDRIGRAQQSLPSRDYGGALHLSRADRGGARKSNTGRTEMDDRSEYLPDEIVIVVSHPRSRMCVE